MKIVVPALPARSDPEIPHQPLQQIHRQATPLAAQYASPVV
jgi:hypothetical protein